jgi:hypothetical protein
MRRRRGAEHRGIPTTSGAGREGPRTLRRSTFVRVISLDGHIIPTVAFLSCRPQPAAAGGRFGSLMLMGVTPG